MEDVLKNILSALNDIKYEMSEHMNDCEFNTKHLDHYTKEIEFGIYKIFGDENV